jgi:DNA-binding transcriptional LysR family regulator
MPELAKYSFVGFRKNSRLDALTELYFSRNRLEPNTVMRLDNADAIRAVLRAGIGYSLLPGWTLREDLESKSLRLIRSGRRPPAAWVEMVRHESSPLAPAAHEFISMAKASSLG